MKVLNMDWRTYLTPSFVSVLFCFFELAVLRATFQINSFASLIVALTLYLVSL